MILAYSIIKLPIISNNHSILQGQGLNILKSKTKKVVQVDVLLDFKLIFVSPDNCCFVIKKSKDDV